MINDLHMIQCHRSPVDAV